MDVSLAILGIGALIFMAHLFERAGVPDVLPLMVLGLIIGPISVIYFGLPLTGGILLGLTAGGRSSAVVIPLLTKLDLRKRASTMLLLESGTAP